MKKESELLTVTEVADVLRVSTMTIYRMAHSGELPCVRVSRSMRIPRVDVQAFATPQTGTQATETVVTARP